MNLFKGFIAFVFGGLSFYYFFVTPMSSVFLKTSYIEICDFIFINYYKEIKGFTKWHEECRDKGKKLPRGFRIREFIESVESMFSRFQTSHLSLWVPNDIRFFWKGISKDTGLRVRNIKDFYIVYEVIDGSSGKFAGFQIGDEVLEINGNIVENEQSVRNQKGTYFIVRNGESLELQVVPRELFFDKRPIYFLIDNETGYLKISSFMAFSFRDEYYISETMSKINKVSQLIIDIRGNTGGDFGAMLRALSFILCDNQSIGVIRQPRYKPRGRKQFPDSLNSFKQLRLMEERVEIDLVPFEGYGCFKKPIVLLMDRYSASVAEIFAYALKQRAKTTIIGENSAGEVVLAILKGLKLGTGYSLSIPHATFMDRGERQIEGIGIVPHKESVYRIDEARSGVDSYVKDALEVFKSKNF